MTRIPRSWQGLGLLLGLLMSLPLLSGQGCADTPSPIANDGTVDNTAGQTTGDNASTSPLAEISMPVVQVLFPNGGEQIEQGSIVATRVFARHDTIPDPILRVFYDRDSDPSNGYMVIGQDIKASVGGTGWDTHGMALGKYYVGVTMVGVTPTVIDYSNTAFDLVPAGSNTGGGTGGGGGDGTGTEVELQLAVSAPRNKVPLFQGAPFTVRWSTSLLPGEGTATIFSEPDLDEDGLPDGESLRDTLGGPGLDAALQRFDIDTSLMVGNFFIGVTIIANDGRTATALSAGTIKIQPPMFWVGSLATQRDSNKQVIPQSGDFRGAVLRGFDIYDNLGSSMIDTDDYVPQRDETGAYILDEAGNKTYAGLSGIVVAAQYAKPGFAQKDGRGAGEAYLIYGNKTRMSGDYDVNNAGQPSMPGLILTGVYPNPHGNTEVGGNKFAFTVDGLPTTGYETEGLRSLAMLPDQDNDGKREIVFGFPWCDSYSLRGQIVDGLNPAPITGEGYYENDGHFLRGGLIILSSQTPMVYDPDAISRHYDRVVHLQEVGQNFQMNPLGWAYENFQDFCPDDDLRGRTVTYPCDGFWQETTGGGYYGSIDPPRLADPEPADQAVIPVDAKYGCYGGTLIDINQVDSPPIPSSRGYFYGRLTFLDTTSKDPDYCGQAFPFDYLGSMPIIGTGYPIVHLAADVIPGCDTRRLAPSIPPYGGRILGQTTTQLNTSTPTTANRFGASISVSNGFLAIGAPLRTPLKHDVDMLPTLSRQEAGEVYLLQMRRTNPAGQRVTPYYEYPWRLPTTAPADDTTTAPVGYSQNIPEPHNYIIDDVGYTRYLDLDWGETSCGYVEATGPGDVRWEMDNPIRIVGAAPYDRIGESVAGLLDVNNDGVDDLAVGGPGTNSGRGAVYILYRRQPEVENDYLLERLQLSPSDPNRHNGLMIVGEEGENLGTAIASPGPVSLKDDYNNDGFSDAVIGSPNATTAGGFEAGKVFILLGGKNLLNKQGGATIPELMDSGDGVLLVGTSANDRAGETVANAGDVNGDGVADFLIAAPNATVPDIKFHKPGTDTYRSLRVSLQYDTDGDGIADATGIGIDRNGDGKADVLNPDDKFDWNGNIVYTAKDDLTDCGVVYLVFGGTHLKGTIGLDEIGTKALPGLILVGRSAGYELGGGHVQSGLLSRGLSSAGDLDGDGFDDLMISSVLADPDGKTNAGEVYVIYGFAP